VADAEELAAAAKDGFLPHDHKGATSKKAAADPEAAVPPADPDAAAPAPAPQKNKGGRPKKAS